MFIGIQNPKLGGRDCKSRPAEYDNHKFDSSYYEALSWQGLMGTDAWKAKSDTTSIKAKINQLLSGRSKNGCND